MDVEELRRRARVWPKGHAYEDFEADQVFEHHWGRTLFHSECALFATNTHQHNPLYFNQVYARTQGHKDIQVAPILVFLVVFGLSVEDLSEAGGVFLGVERLTYQKPVYPGDTLTAQSLVLTKRLSRSNPQSGIVTWQTTGHDQYGAQVICFERSNMVARRQGQG